MNQDIWSFTKQRCIQGAIALTCCMALSACDTVTGFFNDACQDFPKFSHEETLIPDLPSSAQILQKQCDRFLNATYRLVFAIAVDELQALQEQTFLIARISDWQNDASASLLPESSWQRAESRLKQQGAFLESALYGEYLDGTHQVHVLIDTSNTKQYFVYYEAVYVD